MSTPEPELITSGPALTATGLVHRVRVPATNGPHPTVVMVHGRSGTEEVMWVFARALPRDWLLVAPRALYDDDRGGWSWDIRPNGEWPTLDQLQPGSDALARFVAALPDQYDADPERIYLMGFSQGAAVSLAAVLLGSVQPQAVAALVGFTPLDIPADARARLRDLPVLLAVGRDDPTIPMEIAELAAEELIRAGARLDYRAYDTGHKLNARGMRDLADWWRQFQ